MIHSIGTLDYSTDPHKLVLVVDNDIGRFYRSLIPKYMNVKGPMYPSHISVVRNEIVPNLEVWGKYQDLQVDFEYDSFIFNDELYYWLNARSSFLEDVRAELGLPALSEFTRSPDGRHRFHITIGNTKHLRSILL